MKQSVWWYLGPLLAGLAFIIDRVTKQWFIHDPSYSYSLIGQVVYMQLHLNTDMAFSLPLLPWLYYGFIVVIITMLLITLGRAIQHGKLIEFVVVAFILSGALGNLIDRWWYGGVIDFINVTPLRQWHGSVFNLADSYIVGAVFVWVVYLFIYDRPKKVSTHH
ncbi:MAG: signal peptidase II [Candidatus Kerfeldbacteria bacterium]|nr:signal peptidase II [Candidatus Kerfeldbacteria bacterium]